MRHFLAASIVLAGFGICSVAAAENPVPGKPGEGNFPTPEQIKQRLIQQFDANRDGVLSDQEQLQAQEFMRRKGGLVPGMSPGGIPGAAEFLKRFDANGDGQLSPQEKMLAQAAYQRMRNQGGIGGGGGGVTGPGGVQNPGAFPNPIGGAEGFDTEDQDNRDKPSPLVKRFDKDGDGKLNKEEKAAAQAELKKSKTKTKTRSKATKKPVDKSDK